MYFLVACQCVIVLVMASNPVQRNTMVVSGSPNQRFVNELSNRSSRDLPTTFLDYTNPEEKRIRAIQSWPEVIPTGVQRSISITLEQLLIERPNASGTFDHRAKKQEITTLDTNSTKTDDRGLKFFVNQKLERGGNEERPLTYLNDRSVTENRKELQADALSLKKRATGNSTPESSSRKETKEILNRKIDVRLHSTTDVQNIEIPLNDVLKSGKENRQLTPELFVDIQALHQQTTNSRPLRTQHLKQNQHKAEENNIPQALPFCRSKSQQHSRHFVSPISASAKKRYLRFPRQNPIQLSAAAAYQKSFQSLQSTDFSGITSITDFGQPQFRFNPGQINGIKEAYDTIPFTEDNFRKIPSNKVAFIPPKIIHETRILPTPFMTDDPEQKEFGANTNFFTRTPDFQKNEFDFASANGQQHTSIPNKDSIPVSEESSEFENTSMTPIPVSKVSSPPIANEISNHRYEAAVPIIKSVPLNHRPYYVDSEETEDSPAQLDQSEHTGILSDFSNSEDHALNSNSRNNHPRYAGKYIFGYRVSDHETGNNFGHEERRDGDITRGRYHVLLPDGRIQNVNYHVDQRGYHAEVSYDN